MTEDMHRHQPEVVFDMRLGRVRDQAKAFAEAHVTEHAPNIRDGYEQGFEKAMTLVWAAWDECVARGQYERFDEGALFRKLREL